MKSQAIVITSIFSLLVTACQTKTAGGYSGVVEYDERKVAFEVGGRLLERPVARGSEVKAGQLVGRLDDRIERASREVRLEEAEAAQSQIDLIETGPKKTDLWVISSRIAASKAVEARLLQNLERERALLKKQVTPQAVVDDLERQLDHARAETAAHQAQYASLSAGARSEEVESVKARAEVAHQTVTMQERMLERFTITTPVSGVVLDVHVEPGETVAPGIPVATIADISRPWIEVFVPQGDLQRVRLGGKASLKVDALEQTFSGTVEHIASRMEFTPRFIFSEEERPRLVVRVRIRIDDSERKLHAGVPGFVSFL